MNGLKIMVGATMCESCICKAVSFDPPIIIGEKIKDPYIEMPQKEYDSLSMEEKDKFIAEHNEWLSKKVSMAVEVATVDSYLDIKKGAILFTFCNGPSFYFNEKPPKGTSCEVVDNYMSPEDYFSFYKNSKTDEERYSSDADQNAMDAYCDYIEKEIKNATVYDIACLMQVLVKESITPVNVTDFIYDTIVKATRKYEAGEFVKEIDMEY